LGGEVGAERGGWGFVHQLFRVYFRGKKVWNRQMKGGGEGVKSGWEKKGKKNG